MQHTKVKGLLMLRVTAPPQPEASHIDTGIWLWFIRYDGRDEKGASRTQPGPLPAVNGHTREGNCCKACCAMCYNTVVCSSWGHTNSTLCCNCVVYHLDYGANISLVNVTMETFVHTECIHVHGWANGRGRTWTLLAHGNDNSFREMSQKEGKWEPSEAVTPFALWIHYAFALLNSWHTFLLSFQPAIPLRLPFMGDNHQLLLVLQIKPNFVGCKILLMRGMNKIGLPTVGQTAVVLIVQGDQWSANCASSRTAFLICCALHFSFYSICHGRRNIFQVRAHQAAWR